MKMRNGIPAVLICLLITACEEPIHAPLSSVDTDRVVVEGMLTSENTNHLILVILGLTMMRLSSKTM